MNNVCFVEVEKEDREIVSKRYPDALIFEEPLQSPHVLESVRDANVLSCMIYSTCDAETLAKLPNLKMLCTRSVGFDHIDLNACAQRGITVCNVPDYGSHVIAEHVFALLLSSMRHILEADQRVQRGEFGFQGLRGMALRGKTIGIIGTGKIGRRVAQIAHGFGMKILASDQCRTLELEDLLGVRYVPLQTLFAESDIITPHIPATADTTHLIDEKAFSSMKDDVIIVNTARGALIDSAALLRALDSGKVAYALLDVLEHEKNFTENEALITHPKVVTTPHIAFYADDSMRNMYSDCFESIDQWATTGSADHTVKRPNVVCDLPKITHA